jgi:serine/threonine protein kinase
LGSGTYGEVKMAIHNPTKKQFALKIMDKKKLKQCELLAIEREIQVHSRLKHENIVTFSK